MESDPILCPRSGPILGPELGHCLSTKKDGINRESLPGNR